MAGQLLFVSGDGVCRQHAVSPRHAGASASCSSVLHKHIPLSGRFTPLINVHHTPRALLLLWLVGIYHHCLTQRELPGLQKVDHLRTVQFLTGGLIHITLSVVFVQPVIPDSSAHLAFGGETLKGEANTWQWVWLLTWERKRHRM